MKQNGCFKRAKIKVGSSDYGVFKINAPSNLYGISVSSSRINLYWQDNSNNEDGFAIEQSINGITYTLLATVGTNVTSYSCTGLIPVTTYYYHVRAFNTIGDKSDWSNVIAVNTSAIGWSPIASGLYHATYLTTDGTLWGWGRNDWFQLGQGITDTNNRSAPTKIGIDSDWSLLAAGGWSSAGIKTDGTLWTWGNNQNGQLGFGDTSYDGDVPYQDAQSAADWSGIAMGNFLTIALKTNGTIWGCGYNGYGEVGTGGVRQIVMSFTAIGADSDWNMIACGNAHTIARKNNGTIWGWGYNNTGQIGLGVTSGEPPGIAPGVTTPTKIGNDSDWFAIAAGYGHTLAIKNNRTLWVWGGNWTGQLGLGAGSDRWTPTPLGTTSDWAIIAGGKDMLLSYSVAIKTDRTLWAWGDNSGGQLGLGDNTIRYVPNQVGINSDWLTVVASRAFTVALKTDNTVWAWGANNDGELGIGDRYSRNTPTQTGISLPINPPSSLTTTVNSLSAIALYWANLSDNETGFSIERKVGRAGTWGQIATVTANQTSWSDTTVSGTNTYYYRIAAYNALTDSAWSNEACDAVSGDWSFVSAGWYHTLALKTDSTLWAWGYNGYGELGLGDNAERNVPSQIGTASDWSKVEAGAFNTFAIKTNYTIWSWGFNYNGELGLNNYAVRNAPAQINTTSDWAEVSAGGYHTIALKTDSTLWAWGYNGDGALGLGDYASRLTPTQVSTASDWSKIAAGYQHSIALKTNNTIWSWGLNNYGELGLGLGSTIIITPTQIDVSSDWSMITAGPYDTIARKTDGTLWSWGSNMSGQLGVSDNLSRNVPNQVGTDSDWSFINAGGLFPVLIDHTIAMKTNGTIWGWGDNGYWQLGLGDWVRLRQYPNLIDTNTDWSMGSAGGLHTLWLKSNGTIWTCGYNDYGQLGLGDNGYTTDRRNLTLVGE